MDKQNVVYTYNGISLSHKRNEDLTHPTTWMNLENIMLNEINQSQNENYIHLHEIASISKFIDGKIRFFI